MSYTRLIENKGVIIDKGINMNTHFTPVYKSFLLKYKEYPLSKCILHTINIYYNVLYLYYIYCIYYFNVLLCDSHMFITSFTMVQIT